MGEDCLNERNVEKLTPAGLAIKVSGWGLGSPQLKVRFLFFKIPSEPKCWDGEGEKSAIPSKQQMHMLYLRDESFHSLTALRFRDCIPIYCAMRVSFKSASKEKGLWSLALLRTSVIHGDCSLDSELYLDLLEAVLFSPDVSIMNKTKR